MYTNEGKINENRLKFAPAPATSFLMGWRDKGLRSLRSRRPMGFMEEFSLSHPTHCHPRIIFFSIRNFLLFLIYSQGWRRLLCEGFRACSTFFISSLSLDCCNEGKLFHLQHFSSRMREAKSYEKLKILLGKDFQMKKAAKNIYMINEGEGKTVKNSGRSRAPTEWNGTFNPIFTRAISSRFVP